MIRIDSMTYPMTAGYVLETIRCEGYGPGGTAILVDAADPQPQALREHVRRALHAHGGALGAAGSVAYLFNQVGRLILSREVNRVRLAAAAVTAGAEDLVALPDGSFEVLTDPGEFAAVQRALRAAGFAFEDAGIIQRTGATIVLQGEAAQRMRDLLLELRQLDGVRAIYTNARLASEPQ